MSEAFDSTVRVRALNAAHKLRADQVEYLNTLINSKTKGITLEEAYEKQTKVLLEPVIARYWIENKRVVITPVQY